jgi:enoyl-CoA hydratase/carnithine racemase
MADATQNPPAVLVREVPAAGGFRVGVATLNVEKALNSLTLDMIRALDAAMVKWSTDPKIACVVLDGTGTRAFCAGADVRSLRSAIVAHQGPGPVPQAAAFFGEEYRLDYRIHSYPKPVLVWGSGIVMGGGLGLLVGASHRVVTETSRIAMPEINIGLFPDVGGSWFLPRMPGRVGLFLGLTAAPLNGTDALVVGLGDFFLRSGDRDAVMAGLADVAWSGTGTADRIALSKMLRQFAEHAIDSKPESNVRKHADTIERLTDGDTLAEVVAAIAAYDGDDTWLRGAATALAGGSPTTFALVWELWHRAKRMSLDEVFRIELIVALQCCEHPDFVEGVRARLVDKDNKAQWTPPTLERMTDAWVAEHFAAPWEVWKGRPHPLSDLGG